MVSRKFFTLAVIACGYFSGVATGFFLYSYYFPQTVTRIESVKMKRSPGAKQEVTILQDMTTDTVEVKPKGLIRRIFKKRKP